MPSRNDLEQEVDGFPFPYQTPPPKVKTRSSIFSEDFSSSPSPKTITIRGGFGNTKEPYPPRHGMRSYPPLPNSAYNLTSQAHVPQNANVSFRVAAPALMEDGSQGDVIGNDTDDSDSGLEMPLIWTTKVISSIAVKDLDGSAPDIVEINTTTTGKEESEKKYKSINDLVGHIPPRRQALTLEIRTRTKALGDEPAASVSDNTKTRGELEADKIDFDRSSWVMTTPGVSGNLYSGEEQRADYIKSIDSIEEDKWELYGLEYCKVCKEKHIPPGPPITLEDRDTCGAYLPEWFPLDEFDKPWHSYTKMMNEMVRLEEILQGYGHKPNPDEPFWDFQFHEYSSKWRTIGKRGGWWKCRDGEDATDVERECRICHSERLDSERVLYGMKKGDSIAKHLATIKNFIENRMKAVGERDKELALAQIRAEGYPEYIGTRAVEEEKFRNPILARTATMSTIRSHFSADGDATPHSWDSQVRGRSPPRGRSPVKKGSVGE